MMTLCPSCNKSYPPFKPMDNISRTACITSKRIRVRCSIMPGFILPRSLCAFQLFQPLVLPVRPPLSCRPPTPQPHRHLLCMCPECRMWSPHLLDHRAVAPDPSDVSCLKLNHTAWSDNVFALAALPPHAGGRTRRLRSRQPSPSRSRSSSHTRMS
jgi:hypothetical protein